MLTFSTENKEGRITLWKLLSPKSCVTSDQHELSKGLHPESHKCCVIFQTRPRSITTIFYNSAFFSYSPPEQTWPSQTFEPHQLPLERKQISPRESSPQMCNFYPNTLRKAMCTKYSCSKDMFMLQNLASSVNLNEENTSHRMEVFLFSTPKHLIQVPLNCKKTLNSGF